MWKCRTIFHCLVTIVCLLAFTPIIFAETIDDFLLTKYKITGFSLFDYAFERGDQLRLTIQAEAETEHQSKISIACHDNVEFLLGLNDELSAKVEIVATIEHACSCLDSLKYFSTDADSSGEGPLHPWLTVTVARLDYNDDPVDQIVTKVQLHQVEHLPIVNSLFPTHGSESEETNVSLNFTTRTGLDTLSMCENLQIGRAHV